MGKRGPRPVPTRELWLRGSWRAGQRAGEPVPAELGAGAPACPRWLDREARRAWRYLVPILHAQQLLTKLDRPVLVRYCRLWSRWLTCEQHLQKYGDTYPRKDPATGKVAGFREWPQVDIASSLARQLGALERELGFSPLARRRMRLVLGGARQLPTCAGTRFDVFMASRDMRVRAEATRR